MTYAIYWNPAPVVTHVVDESSSDFRTLCGVRLSESWESGETYEARDLNAVYCGCLRCNAIAERIAKTAEIIAEVARAGEPTR